MKAKRLAEVQDQLLRQAEDILEILDSNEIRGWQKHPCTQYILKRIAAEYFGYHTDWEVGALTDQSESGTLQLNATALGAIGALNAISDDIENLEDVVRAFLTDTENEDEHGN